MAGGVKMNVRFIDTSIMLNLLGVPGRCKDREAVVEEWQRVLENKETLVMPIATIIETGNHIAHINDGKIRRTITLKFQEYLKKTAESKAPWQLYGNGLDVDEIRYLADHMEDFTKYKVGIGDLTIIYAYKKYIEEQPAIGTIMIWSTDEHLASYRQENLSMTRRRRR